MAIKVIASGNFFILKDSTTGEEYARNPRIYTTYTASSSDVFSFKRIPYTDSSASYKELYRGVDFADIVDENGAAFADVDTFKVFLDANIGGNGSSTVTVNTFTGWGNYNDTQYSSGSPFSLTANTDTILPNDSGSSIETQKPIDVTSFVEVVDSATSGLAYDHSKITGRNGDGLLMTIDFIAIPSDPSATYLEVWVDIGGGIGELYKRIITFPKGSGIDRPINFSSSAYTLGTWETNGATVYVRSNGACDLHSIRYVLTRTHKAR